MRKLFDVTVKTGEYTTKDGAVKGRYQTVGSVVETKDGRQVILLSRWFNPAGVPDARNGETILLGMYEPREPREGGYNGQRSEPPVPPPASPELQEKMREAMKRATSAKRVDDNIPF
jgi:hypothetical protein